MVITVFGLGFVGLTTALGFSEYGHIVYGVEVNEKRLLTIQRGQLPFLEPGLDKALEQHLNKNFHPITTAQLRYAIEASDCIYYCVGTPYGENGQADLTYLFKAIDQTIQQIHDSRFRVLVVKSTIPPSTTGAKIIPYFEDKGIKMGDRFGIANNPEFLREGHCWNDFMHADRIVLGVSDKRSELLLQQIYEKSLAPVFCVSLNTAEFIKYLSNTLLATLVSFSNEMSVVADQFGDIDVAQAFRILHLDKRWGDCNMASYVYPGCGYGGYCLPKDTNALYSVSKQAGYDARILKNVIIVNDEMPNIIAKRIIKDIDQDKSKKLGILGLSFKPESDDVRDTPSAKIISCLLQADYNNILAYDPVANDEFKTYYNFAIIYYSDYEKIIEDADVLIIVTAWPEFQTIHSCTNKKVIDCRYML